MRLTVYVNFLQPNSNEIFQALWLKSSVITFGQSQLADWQSFYFHNWNHFYYGKSRCNRWSAITYSIHASNWTELNVSKTLITVIPIELCDTADEFCIIDNFFFKISEKHLKHSLANIFNLTWLVTIWFRPNAFFLNLKLIYYILHDLHPFHYDA